MNQVANYNKPVMSSREIAVQAGKMHKNVMQSIRDMEPAWEKVCGLKFQLTSRDVPQPNGGFRKENEYLLTKTETLYIATKFNDEARARLILRWEELETQQQPKDALDQLLQRANLELQLRIEQRDKLNIEIEQYRRTISMVDSPDRLLKEVIDPKTLAFLEAYTPLWKSVGFVLVRDFRLAYNNFVDFENRIGIKYLLSSTKAYCEANGINFKPGIQKRIKGSGPSRVHIFD